MKKALLLGTVIIGMLTACNNGKTNEAATDTAACTRTGVDSVPQYKEAEDIHLDGKQTEYVLIFRANGCSDRLLREVENDSVALENFYIAEDDLGYYYYMCSERLEAIGAKWHETHADKTVFCQGDMAFQPQDSCDCGVLIIKPGCHFEFISYIDFLTRTDSLVE